MREPNGHYNRHADTKNLHIHTNGYAYRRCLLYFLTSAQRYLEY